jgi:uncharacterized membrane protein YbhN (UPF0104 family)
MSSTLRRIAPPIAKLAILAAVVWGGHRTISNALGDLKQHDWQISQLQLAWAALSGLLYLLSQLPCGWFWHGVLQGLGQRVELPRALRAYYIGHLGKYVPGKAMVVVLRATLIGQPHVKTSLAVVAVFYETFTTMACGAAMATIFLLAARRDIPWLIVGSIALIFVVGLPTIPPVFVRLLRIMRIVRADPNLAVATDVAKATDSVEPAIHLSLPFLVRGWLTIAIGWIFAGASLWATIRAIGVENSNLWADLPLYTATVALAIVLGFVSMLPAGVGVRDIVLMELLARHLEQLAPLKGQLLALVAVIVLRLVWLAAEVVLSAVLYPLGRNAAGSK